MTTFVLARRARRELTKLDWPLTDAIENALGLLERQPEAGHRLRGRLTGLWSLRVGVYRIRYLFDDGHRIVRVVAVRHRSIADRSDPR